MHDFAIKKGDTRPSLEVQCLDKLTREPKPFDAVDKVRFHMERVDGNTVVDDTATVVSEDEARVAYTWNDGDTDETGRYNAEFEVHYANGGIETFPNDGYISVTIGEDVA